MKRTPYLIALISVMLASVAGAEPCAWVLWDDSGSTRSGDNVQYRRTVTPKAAYDNRQECLKDVRMEATRKVETYKHIGNVKRVRSFTQVGATNGSSSS